MMVDVRNCDVRTKEQIKNLEDQQYTRMGASIMEPFMYKYWWMPLVSLVPRTMNATVITVFGLSLNIISMAILLCFSPMAAEEAPRWAYALASVMLFLYQTCDALDGQQCNRYKTEKDHHQKVAEIFDHACDSITQVCVTIELGICMQLGYRPDLFISLMLTAMFMFFTAHWQTYISGVVRFSMFDVTEGELALCGVFLTTAIFGPQIWAQKVLWLETRELIVVAMAATAVMKLINQALFVWRQGYSQTTAGTSIVSPLMHIGSVFLLAIVTTVTTDLYEYQPCVFLIIFGLIEAKMSIKFMLAYMYKSKVAFVDIILLGPVFLLLANHFMKDLLPGHVLLYLVMVFCATNVIRCVTVESLRVCNLLDISCFAPYQFPIKDE